MIDLEQLPDRVLLDTGVLLRALRHKPGNPETPACIAVYEFVVTRRRLLVAAPSIAEILRGKPDAGAEPHELPRIPNVLVVPFDHVAAEITGSQMPFDQLLSQPRDGYFLHYLKYDALIAGAAVRHKAGCIVTLDGGMRTRYSAIIPIYHPADFGPATPSGAGVEPRFSQVSMFPKDE